MRAKARRLAPTVRRRKTARRRVLEALEGERGRRRRKHPTRSIKTLAQAQVKRTVGVIPSPSGVSQYRRP